MSSWVWYLITFQMVVGLTDLEILGIFEMA